MPLSLITLALLSSPALAADIDLTENPYTVDAGGTVLLDASETDVSSACWLSRFVGGAPGYEVEFRWDLDNNGVFDLGWGDQDTLEFDAAGLDGPMQVEIPLEARCWYFDATSFIPLQGSWELDTDAETVLIDVLNLPPVVGDITPVGHDPGALPAGNDLQFRVDAFDPEADDTLTYTWIWADGLTTMGNPTTRSLSAGAAGVRVEVTDDDGATTSGSASFSVVDPPPGIVSQSVPTQIDEGETLQVSVVAEDPAGDPVTVLWRFADGTESTEPDASWTPSGEGVFTVELFVSDGNSTIERTFQVEVVNVDPVFGAIPALDPILEGETVRLQAPASDPGGDTLHWTWQFGDNTPAAMTSGDSVDYAYRNDDGLYVVDVTVDDGEGGSVSDQILVTVENRDPRITSFVVPQQLSEGEVGALSVSAQDVPGDPITYSWNFGDGSVADGATVNHIWASGNYTVRVAAEDDDGGSTTREIDITVSNTAPVATDLVTPQELEEGEEGLFSIDVNDAGGDTVTVLWTFGDGATATGENVAHTYAADGTYDGTVLVSDSGGASTPYVFVVEVLNGAPVFTSQSLPDRLDEGEVARFSASATDPGNDDITFEWYVDGSQVATGPIADLAFADDGSPVVRVDAVDADGGRTSVEQVVTVLNVAPTVSLLGDTSDGVEPTLSWSVDVVDPGADTFVYRWNFGDGTVSTTLFGVAGHTYESNGTYTVTVEVEDDDAGIGSSQLIVVIDSIGPASASIAPPADVLEGELRSFVCGALDAGETGQLHYSWDFGDGGSGEGEAVQHSFDDDGIYTVTCTVLDGAGREAEAQVEVLVSNVVPTLSGTPSATTLEGGVWSFTPSVDEPGVVDELAFDLVGPAGATVDGAGVVSWSVPVGALGDHAFELTVSDEVGSSSLSWTLEVLVRDDDGDGLSDSWESAVGLDPTDPSDAADDPDGDGRTNLDEFELGTNPLADDRPVAPVLGLPIQGVAVDVLQPLLNALPGDDREVEELDFELYADASLTQLVQSRAQVELNGVGAVWRVEQDLIDNTTYWWTARAFDGFGHGPWAAPESFVVNAVQDPPGTPLLITPVDQATVPTTTPTLTWSEVTDPDGDAVTYEVRVVRDGVSEVGASGVEAFGGSASWTLDPPGEDLQTFCWAVTAIDITARASEESGERCFTIDEGNLPPSAPVILRPEDGGVVDRPDPIIQVENGVDPEGREVTIVFELSDDETFGAGRVLDEVVPADPSGRSIWTPTGLAEDVWYHLRVAASDGAAQSDWVYSSFFINEFNDAPLAPRLLNPADGTAWSTGMSLEIIDGIDPEGFAVAHRMEIRDDVGVLQLSDPIEATDGLTRWTPARLPAGMVFWRARAIDVEGAEGAWSETWTVEVPGDDSFVNSRVVPPPSVREALVPTELGCASGCATGGGSSPWWLVALVWALGRRSRP